MKKIPAYVLMTIAAVLNAGEPIELFNGKDLSGWYKFLKGYGRDNDPKNVISVTNGVIRITGEVWGALVTEKEFSDYRLTVEYRFDGTKFPSKEKYALDSGILFHSTGKDGGFAGIWMASHEYNIIQGASGDLWGVHPKNSGMSFTGNERGVEKTISGNDRIARFDIDPAWSDRPDAPLAWNENQIGEWNVAVLECRGDSALCYFNGKLVNSGTAFKPSRGRIQLQSEGCGIEFRRITIEPLDGKTAKASARGPTFGVVKASMFGFDPEDSTEAVQKALDSDAAMVILERMPTPWTVRPLKVRSNTQLVFEDGAELVAKRGEFHGVRDALLECIGVSNVTIRGMGERGGICRMWKCDYRDQTRYSKAEWRCCLRIASCTDMTVENMAFCSSGGDGITIGAGKGVNTRNLVIRDCVCDDNYRQGISLCGAEHVLIENTVLSNTEGTAPSAGIDFEPDKPNQYVSDVTLRNVVSTNNAGSGFELAFPNMRPESKPVSLRFENCLARDCRVALSLVANSKRDVATLVRGSVIAENCRFEKSRIGLLSRGNPAGAIDLTLSDCTLSNNMSDVIFESANPFQGIPDGVFFDRVRIFQHRVRDWFRYSHTSFGPASRSVRGDVEIVRPDGKREHVVIDPDWCAKHLPVIGDGTIPPPLEKLPLSSEIEVVDACPGRSVDLAPVATAFRGSYLMFAEKGATVNLTFSEVPRNKTVLATKWRSYVRFLADDGTKRFIRHFDAPGYKPADISFTAPERGFYRLYTPHGDFRYIVYRSNVPIAVDLASNDMLAGYKNNPFSVWMPVTEGRRSLFSTTGDGYYRFRFSATDTAGGKVFDSPSVDCMVLADFPVGIPSGLCELSFAPAAKPRFGLIRINGSGNANILFLSREKHWRVARAPEKE